MLFKKINYIQKPVYLAAFLLRLATLRWVLNLLVPGLVIGMAIIFQPELRRIFTRLGQGTWLRLHPRVRTRHLEAVLNAAEVLAAKRCGALIVFSRNIGLNTIVETGTRLNAELSSSLLLNLFAGRRQALEAFRGEGLPGDPDLLYEHIVAVPADRETIVGLQEKLQFMLNLVQQADAMLFNATVLEEIAFGPRQLGLPDLDRRVGHDRRTRRAWHSRRPRAPSPPGGPRGRARISTARS